jgi:hypothetical protein
MGRVTLAVTLPASTTQTLPLQGPSVGHPESIAGVPLVALLREAVGRAEVHQTVAPRPAAKETVAARFQ